MSDFNVAGLSSGIDTTALLDGLMYSEGATQRRLEASKARDQRALDAWGTIQTKLSVVESAVTAIRTGSALASAKAASSNETVARVTASAGALTGTYAFQVTSLAAANQLASLGLADASALVGAGTATVSAGLTAIGTTLSSHTLNDGTYQLDVLAVDVGANEATVLFDGVEQTVDTSGGSFVLTAGDGGTVTLAGTPEEGAASITVAVTDATTTAAALVSKLNTPGGPVRAQLIDTGDGSVTPVRLVVTSRTTGLDGAAEVDLSGLSAFSGGLTTLRAASNAVVTLGGGGLAISRPTNTINDLFAGVTVDLVSTTSGSDVQVTVGADVDAQVKAVKAVVNAMSDVLRSISAYTSYDVETKTGGVLVGDFTSRSVSSELQQAMGHVVGSASFVLLSQIGVSFQRDGTYKIDDVALRQALVSNADGVADLLVGDPTDDADGVLDAVASTIDRLGDNTGRITTAKASREASIKELTRAIALQDVRLADVEDRYRRQFAAMETLLGQLQGQSSYLSSAIGGLNK